MERLTRRIGAHVYYTQGMYEDTIPVEMETQDVRKVLKKLAAYEDAEEQGLLLRLPCKIGDTIYVIDDLNNMVLRGTAKGFTEDKIRTARGYLIHVEYKNSVISESWEEFSKIGKTVFLTKEEAEQALARMEEGV